MIGKSISHSLSTHSTNDISQGTDYCAVVWFHRDHQDTFSRPQVANLLFLPSTFNKSSPVASHLITIEEVLGWHLRTKTAGYWAHLCPGGVREKGKESEQGMCSRWQPSVPSLISGWLSYCDVFQLGNGSVESLLFPGTASGSSGLWTLKLDC